MFCIDGDADIVHRLSRSACIDETRTRYSRWPAVCPRYHCQRRKNVFRFAELPLDKRILDTATFTFNNNGKPLKNKTFAEYTCLDGGASSFIIIQNDTIKYEHYKGWLKQWDNVNIFSVSKSITALMCGIAVKEGKIRSIDDCVTDYVPELLNADEHFQRLTIRHLLNMQAGLKYKESYSNPFRSMALLYFGHNAFKQIKKLKFKNEPGTKYEYNSMTTAILSYVLERATGVKYAAYLSEKLWKPLGMEMQATVTLDSKKHRNAKSYGGINTNVRDLAKIGRLVLNEGNWNGKQIVDSAWIAQMYVPAMKEDKDKYSLGWYNFSKSKAICAIGLFGQTIFVYPKYNVVAVRLGENKRCQYDVLVRDVVDRFAEKGVKW
ncbi:serine hydrolase domain-containing protein [Prevotella falsenii]|uniref:serine hydrolase domain-containing protein n=1 Tax=Prevotella falsenii TaxID=515414 RepID=UPI001E37BD1A|nr:serine hydrolase [Prevotella falsenii]